MNTALAKDAPAPRDPNAQKRASGVPAPRRPSPLARTAWLIHLLALVFAIGGWLLLRWLNAWSEAGLASVGMGGAAAGVLALWSLLLAVRSWRRGEGRLSAGLLMGVVFLELSLPCAWTWYPLVAQNQPRGPWQIVAFRMGLPVWIPFAFLAGGVALAVAIGRVRWAERRDRAAGKPAWDEPRRWRHGRKCFLGMLAAQIVLLPFPLFVFCALRNAPANTGGAGVFAAPPWTRIVAEYTPAYVKAATLNGSMGFHGQVWNTYRRKLIVGGAWPPGLLAHLAANGPLGLRWRAFSLLSKQYPLEVLRLGDRVARRELRVGTSAQNDIGSFYAQKGPLEKIRTYLAPTSTAPAMFRIGLLLGLSYTPRLALLPELARALRTITRHSSPIAVRSMVLSNIIFRYPPEAVKRLWRGFLEAEDVSLIEDALEGLKYADPALQLELYFLYLRSKDIRIRRRAAGVVVAFWKRTLTNEETALWVKGLLSFLDDPDLVVRRGVVWNVALLLKLSLKHTLPCLRAAKPGVPGASVLDGAPPAPKTETERTERVWLRQRAEKWLQRRPARANTKRPVRTAPSGGRRRGPVIVYPDGL